MQNINIYFDGGSKPNGRGNPWRGYGSYEIEAEGLHFKMEREQFGAMTCNQAEYTALIKALEWCVPKIPHGVKPIINIFTDSKLVEGHLIGSYRVTKHHLRVLVGRTQVLLDQFGGWVIQWRPRKHNVKRFGH